MFGGGFGTGIGTGLSLATGNIGYLAVGMFADGISSSTRSRSNYSSNYVYDPISQEEQERRDTQRKIEISMF